MANSPFPEIKSRKIDTPDEQGWTALMRAAQEGDFELVGDLLECGAKINMRCVSGATALMMAASRGHEEVVRVLLERYPRTRLKNSDGKNARMIATENGHNEIAELLKKRVSFERKAQFLAWTLLLMFSVLFVIQVDWSGDKSKVGLHSAVRFLKTEDNAGYLELKNNDSFDWRNVVIGIETGGNGWFYHRISSLRPGSEYTVRYHTLLRDDGEELHPLGHKPITVCIEADTPHGKGYWVTDK